MKFRCASNAAMKHVKIARKKNNFFQNIYNKITIFLKKNKVYFQILEVLPVILTTYLPV